MLLLGCRHKNAKLSSMSHAEESSQTAAVLIDNVECTLCTGPGDTVYVQREPRPREPSPAPATIICEAGRGPGFAGGAGNYGHGDIMSPGVYMDSTKHQRAKESRDQG